MDIHYGILGRIVQIGDMAANCSLWGRFTSIGNMEIHYSTFGRMLEINSSQVSVPTNAGLSHQQVAALVIIMIQALASNSAT